MKEKTPWFNEFRGFRYLSGCGDIVKKNITSFWSLFRALKLTDTEIPFPTLMTRWGFENTPRGLSRAKLQMSLILFFCTLFSCFAAANMMFGINEGNIVRTLGNGAFLLTSLAVVWVTAWRRDVIVNKRYVPLRRWALKLRPWTTGFLLLVSLSCLSDGFQAFAAEQFDLPKQVKLEKTSDISADIFSAIFGKAWETVTGHTVANNLPVTYNGLLPKIVEMLNYAVLVYVCIFMFYLWVLFAVAGAEGKGGGGRSKASMWKVFRQVFTVSFSVPVLHGFSMLQVFVIGAISLGINFANIIWDGTTDYLVQNAGQNLTVSAPPVVEFQATNAAMAIFEQAVRQAYGRQTKRYTSSKNVDCPLPDGATVTGGSLAAGYVRFEEKNGAQNVMIFGPTDRLICSGALRFRVERPSNELASQAALEIAKEKIALMERIWTGILPYANHYILNYKVNGKNILEENVAGIKAENSFSLEALFKDYRTNIINHAQTMLKGSEGENFKKMMRAALNVNEGDKGSHLGWATAGLFSYSIASVQRSVESALGGDIGMSYGFAATGVSEDYPISENTGSSERQRDINDLSDVGFLARIKIALGLDKSATDVEACLAEAPKYFVRNVLKNTALYEESFMGVGALFKIFFGDSGSVAFGASTSEVSSAQHGIISGMMYTLTNNDPVLALVSIGDRMIKAGVMLMGAMAASQALTAITGMLAPIGSLVTNFMNTILITLGSLGYLLCGALFMGGILLCYVLPLVPAIFWIRALLSWVYLVLESIIAASFWIVSHMMPDEGVGFVSTAARRGYMLLVDIVIRPPLLVIGVVFSLILIRIFGVFASELLSIFFNTLGGEKVYEGFGPIDQVVFGFLVAYFLYTLCYTIFVKGVNHLPLNISRWVGGSALSLGEENDSTTFSHAGNFFKSGTAQIGRMLYGSGGRGPKSPRGTDKDNTPDKGGAKSA